MVAPVWCVLAVVDALARAKADSTAVACAGLRRCIRQARDVLGFSRRHSEAHRGRHGFTGLLGIRQGDRLDGNRRLLKSQLTVRVRKQTVWHVAIESDFGAYGQRVFPTPKIICQQKTDAKCTVLSTLYMLWIS